MILRPFIAIPLLLALAACGDVNSNGGGGKIASVATKPPLTARHRPALHTPPPAAQVLALPGLEGVIGARADELGRQFGSARLDVWEGDARKLQFGGVACVLDIYLYPKAAGREPQATYVDARRASDGQDVDRASCIAALRQRPGVSPRP